MSSERVIHEIVTANRLVDGAVVYLTATGDWSERFADAAAAEGEAAKALLAIGEAAAAAQIVVAPYLAEASVENGRLWPLGMKERIRSRGPSIHPELGKQAEGKAA